MEAQARAGLTTMNPTNITCYAGSKSNRLPLFFWRRHPKIIALLHGGVSDGGVPIVTAASVEVMAQGL
jgi:hypothetical protein